MINYIKSECYRVFRGKTIYMVTLVLLALIVGVHAILFGFRNMTEGFTYATVHFSFSNLISDMTFLFYGALLIVSFLSSEEYKSGVIKNAVAGGISRNQIFLGKCLVYCMAALFSFAVILAGYIISAYIFLERESTNALEIMLKGIAVNLPAAFAAVILAVALYSILGKELYVALIWLSLVCLIPIFCFWLGLKIDFFSRIAEWMPMNYLRYENHFAYAQRMIQAMWMEPRGVIKCLVAGGFGIAGSLVLGIAGFRKKDI